jgi:Calcineurin-like phosphoesterase
MRRTLVGIWLVLGCLGCGKRRNTVPHGLPPAATPSGQLAAAATEPPAPAVAPDCQRSAGPLRQAGAERLVAIGDLHGDVGALADALRAANAVDERGHWSGGSLVVVQTGDVLDRGDGEQRIIDWLEQLEQEASAAGGEVIWLLGNHELMNAAGDFRYVTPGGFADFEDVPELDLRSAAALPPQMRARAAAFHTAPPGPYARILAGQATVRIIGDTLFSHAGVLPAWSAKLEELNREADCWLQGTTAPDQLPAALVDQTSPVWTRALGGDAVDCAAVREVLSSLGVRRMVVGHTVQAQGITSACEGALWRIDVGLAAPYGGPIEVLELSKGSARVVRGQRQRTP